MPDTRERPYEVLKTERHQIGRIQVVKDTIRVNGHERPYTYVEYRDSVCVLALYEGRVVVIDQYRHALNQWELELPCGGVDEGESPEQAARRELEEETGFVAGEMISLGSYYTNQGYSSAQCSVFFTRCVRRGRPHREEAELIRTLEVSAEEFEALMDQNRFRLLIGMTAWNQAKRRGLI